MKESPKNGRINTYCNGKGLSNQVHTVPSHIAVIFLSKQNKQYFKKCFGILMCMYTLKYTYHTLLMKHIRVFFFSTLNRTNIPIRCLALRNHQGRNSWDFDSKVVQTTFGQIAFRALTQSFKYPQRRHTSLIREGFKAKGI